MCGIAGQLNSHKKPADKRLVQRMAQALAHRGPDGEGFYFGENVGLAHRRLAVIDLKTGHQPMTNEDKSLWLVSNGEIYNFLELRDELKSKGHRFSTTSDTEVILHLYEELGERCVEKLVGMFAFSIWDQKRKRLFLARDRFGVKPLYYFYDPHFFLFASELKALLQCKKVSRALNFSAFDQYFTLLYTVEPHTIFREIHKLLPGHSLSIEGKTMTVRKYWDLSPLQWDPRDHPGERIYADQLRSQLSKSIDWTLRSDVPTGVFLSGGVDSSVVAALSAKSGQPVKTFSIGFREGLFDESPYSRLVAQSLNTEHHEFILTQADAVKAIPEIAKYLDEPFGDASAIPTYYVSKLARQFVKVVLTGEGGDELFAGYLWHDPQAARNKGLGALPTLPYDTLGRLRLYSADLKAELGKDLFPGHWDIDCTPSRKQDPLQKLLHLDLKTYLPSDLLVKVDRMSMANSLEARVPFLNHSYAEFVMALPSKFKIRHGVRKYLFKKTFRKMLPPKIAKRSKMGFSIPLDIWLWEKGRFREMVYDVLFDSKTRHRGYFNYRFIERMFSEHDKLTACHGYRIWALFMFELWQRNFLI